MNPKATSDDFDVFNKKPIYATYGNIKRGDMVSNGDHFGIIEMAAFDCVLVNWQGINPQPFPPGYYPKDIWNFTFGGNYVVIEEAQS